MTDTLVVGYGSDLRGDDAAGRAVAEMVEAAGHRGIRVVSVHQLTPEIAAELAGCRRAVFIDADPATAEVTVRELSAGNADHRSSHHSTPESLLRLAEDLYGCSPVAHLVAVPASSFDLGSDLSPATRAALPAAADAVESLLS